MTLSERLEAARKARLEAARRLTADGRLPADPADPPPPPPPPARDPLQPTLDLTNPWPDPRTSVLFEPIDYPPPPAPPGPPVIEVAPAGLHLVETSKGDGAPGECPSCGAIGKVDMVDLIGHITHLSCGRCGTLWQVRGTAPAVDQ